jgi:predicted nucleic acid-binding Zn ribbon protein
MAERLAEILDAMDVGAGKTIRLCGLLSLWKKVVDERVGRNTEAVKISNKVLYVSASSPAWAQELSFLKTDFVAKFNREAGKEAIRDIRFRSGG